MSWKYFFFICHNEKFHNTFINVFLGLYGGNDVNGKILRENCSHWDMLYGPSWLSLFCIQSHNSPYLGSFYRDQRTFSDKVTFCLMKILIFWKLSSMLKRSDSSYYAPFRWICILLFQLCLKTGKTNSSLFPHHIKETVTFRMTKF